MNTLFSGSPVFMGILTLVLTILLVWCFYNLSLLFKSQGNDLEMLSRKFKLLTSIGLFALIIGVLDQLLSLYSIISAIEQAGDINPGIVLSALKTSVIPLIFGVCTYLLSFILRLVTLSILNARKVPQRATE